MADIAIFRINYKSDFVLTLNSDAGWMTPFCIKFWTGAPSQAYFAGYDGTTYTHCAPVAGEPTKLQVQFDDHHLPIGDLMFQIGYHFTVSDFPTSVEDEVLNQASVIIEVDDAPAQVMLDLNGETAPEIEFSLPAYANEAQRIANEEQRIAHEEARIQNEETRISAEQVRQQNETQRISREQARQNNEAQRIEREQARQTNEAQRIEREQARQTNEEQRIEREQARQTNEDLRIQREQIRQEHEAQRIANETERVTEFNEIKTEAVAATNAANAAASLANEKAEYAKEQGDYAKEQGDYAKEQGDTALADHERAEADHTTAAADHTQAVADHTQAASDHTRAEVDHSTASADHTTATNDHTQAATDHATATSDHTQAGNDHTRAESDHTRAESDHAAVEVYVDSLGAFDISSYHATGSVLAKYADLTAALGTNGANIPDVLRKGGMSVKFVQSSDNKYVQYRLMANSFSTTVSDWQGVDAEPTVNSKNLVESGGVKNKLDEISIEIDGELSVEKDYVWSNGYVTSSGGINTNNHYQYSQPVLFHDGETLFISVTETMLKPVIEVADDTQITPQSTGIIVSVLIEQAKANFEYSCKFSRDTYIVLSVPKDKYSLSVTRNTADSVYKRIDVLEKQVVVGNKTIIPSSTVNGVYCGTYRISESRDRKLWYVPIRAGETIKASFSFTSEYVQAKFTQELPAPNVLNDSSVVTIDGYGTPSTKSASCTPLVDGYFCISFYSPSSVESIEFYKDKTDIGKEVYDLINKVPYALEELATIKGINGSKAIHYYSFIKGGLSNTIPSALFKNLNMITVIIPLDNGVTYMYSDEGMGNFSVVRSFYEDSEGSLSTRANLSNKIVGNNDTHKALWICYEDSSIPNIKEWDYTGLYASMTIIDGADTLRFDSIVDSVDDTNSKVDADKDSCDFDAAVKNISDVSTMEDLSTLEQGLESMYLAKGLTSDTNTLTLPHSNGGLFILNVHKAANDGYVVANNAYLPNARTDFSDVCVIGDSKPLALRKIYSGNIDIIPDSRIRGGAYSGSDILHDSEGRMFNCTADGPSYSEDGGKTWTVLTGFSSGFGNSFVALIDDEDTVFVGKDGVLYRSEKPYTTASAVYNENDYHDGSIILSEHVVQHPVTKRIFIGNYQEERDIIISCSDDHGVTWSVCYRDDSGTYQHVHRLFVDNNHTPVAIYAGVDGGGGVFRTTDNGNTWLDLKNQEGVTIPQASDRGVVYSDQSGFRLISGETSIVGGVSIIKTTDDMNFRPVLANGGSVFCIQKLGGKVFAGINNSTKFRNTQIVMSEDGGETWKAVYVYAPWANNAANTGFRILSEPAQFMGYNEAQIIARAGYFPRTDFRIFSGGDHYFAQFLVDVPAGISSITVESGHFGCKERNLYNKFGYENPVFGLPFNLDTNVVDLYGEKTRYEGMEIVDGGRHIGGIWPDIVSPEDRSAARLMPGSYFTPKDLDLSSGDFHIGYWYKSNVGNRYCFLFAKDAEGNESKLWVDTGYVLRINGTTISSDALYPKVKDCWMRVDLNIDSDKKLTLYVNGEKEVDEYQLDNDSLQQYTVNNFKCMYVPTYAENYRDNSYFEVQYFEISMGNITDDDALNNYYGGLFDVE